ncbi:MAG: hypothetical protein K6E91_15120 [Butyrivibrio sp.]|nr:hypothetical protein [Butyrivibrio sp.]
MIIKKKFPKILLSITVILALVFAGLVTPGFMLPLLTPTIQEQPNPDEVIISTESGPGNSRAFEITPDEGFKISAEENALDKDRSFAVTRLEDEKLRELTETALSNDEIDIVPMLGWEVDAGMEPDDRMPGVFHMEFDLAEYGIPEDLYSCMSAYHIDDDGKWEEYVSEVKGSTLCIDASHNGLTVLGVVIRISFGAVLAYVVHNHNTPERGMTNVRDYDVYEKDVVIDIKHTDDGDIPVVQNYGKKIYTLKFDLSEEIVAVQKENAQIENETFRSCEEDAIASLKRDFGENYLQNINTNVAYAMTVARQVKLYHEKLASNRQYKLNNMQIKIYLADNKHSWNSAHRMAELVRTAYFYLKDVAKVKMPTYCPVIVLATSDEMTSKGDMTSQYWPSMRSFTVAKIQSLGVDENSDTMILSSITHEMAHQCQREYCSPLLSNAKYDEACAQLLEEQAYEWYKRHTLNISFDQDGKVTASFDEVPEGSGIMKSEPELKNGKDYKYYACEMDSSSSYTWLTSDATDFRYNYGPEADTTEDVWYKKVIFHAVKEDSSLGYPYARFLDYLWKDYEARTEWKMTWNRLFNMYLWVDFPKPGLSSLLKTAFKLDESGLTKKYTEFAQANKTVFYGYSIENEGQYYNPTIGSRTKNGGKIKLKNQNYTIMTRFLDFYYPEGYNRQAALLLKQDEGFKTTFPDMTLIPIGNTDCQPCKHGLFYNPQSLEALIQGAILEVDGGTQGIVKRTWNWFTSPKVAEGYSLWTLLAPDEITPEVKNGQIVFRMPEKSDAVEAKLIDGYRVTYFASTSPEKPYIEELDTGIAGQERSLNLDKLIPEDLISQAENEDLVDRVTFTVSVCEFIKDQDGTKHYGPESNPGGGMSALLSEMGAHDGRITVTLHWFGPDDLDLHCITPMGGHISYENKESDGGYLDVDMNIEGDRRESVEHIYFDKPDAGDYQFYVVNYTDRTDGDCTAEIYISVEGKQIIADKASMGGRSKTWKIRTYPATKKESGAEYLIAEPVTDG